MSAKKTTKAKKTPLKNTLTNIVATGGPFLPEGYELPKSEGYYLKLQEGDTRPRILTRAVPGWEAWFDGKPKRAEGEVCPFDPSQVDLDEKFNRPNMSHFWGFLVWNADEKKVQIWQVTQKSILAGLWTLLQQDEWGDPRNYGIIVSKTVTKGKTEYKVNAVPPKPVSQEIKDALTQTTLTLDMLFEEPGEEEAVIPAKKSTPKEVSF